MIGKLNKLLCNKYHYMIFITVFSFLLSFDGIISPYFFGEMTDTLARGEYVKSQMVVLVWLCILCGLAACKTVLNYLQVKLKTHIRIDLKNKHAINSQKYLDVPTVNFLTVITSEIGLVEAKYIDNIFLFIVCIFQWFITTMFLLNINGVVSLLFILLGSLPVLISNLSAKWISRSVEKWQLSNKKYLEFLDDFLKSRRLVKRFASEQNVFSVLNKKLIQTENSYKEVDTKQSVVNNVISLVYVITLFLGLFFGIHFVSIKMITVGELIAIYLASDRVVSPFLSIIQIMNVFKSNQKVLDNVLIEHSLDNVDIYTYSDTPYALVLKDVTVGFDSILIGNINETFNYGEKVLIKGESGSGKSTLLKTITNEVIPHGGQIILSKQYENCRTVFGVVEQTPFLFDETVWFNMTLGHSFNEDDVIKTLKTVGLSQLATRDRLYEKIEKQSKALSGGEAKRLEIARALLFKSDILVVDEGLSGLDEKSASKISELILSYPGLVIAVEHHMAENFEKQFDKILTIQYENCLIRIK